MNVYLVYLAWPETCFAASAADLKYLKTLVPKGARVVSVKDDAAFLKVLPQATHVITWDFKREWYALAPKLRVLATPAAGRELVSREAPKGVRVHFGGFQGAFMAESVAAFVLSWARGFYRPEAHLAWGRNELSPYPRSVAGTKAVILGYGRVGRQIGAKLSALGVEVFGHSRHLNPRPATLDARLRTADWLILALPSDTGTDNLLNAKMIAKLPRRCVIVNVGRGNAVDEKALLAALRGGRLAGAYLDVFKSEPGHFRAASEDPTAVLLDLPRKKWPWNLVMTPHASAFSQEYVRACFRELKDDRCL